MSQSLKKINLYHCPIFFFPLINTFLYELQIFLVSKEFIENIFISHRENYQRDRLLKLVSKNADYIIVRSHNFGRILKNINDAVLDIEVDPMTLAQEELLQLMWSLVFTKYVTAKTQKSLKDFIFKKDFPVLKI